MSFPWLGLVFRCFLRYFFTSLDICGHSSTRFFASLSSWLWLSPRYLCTSLWRSSTSFSSFVPVFWDIRLLFMEICM